MHFELTTPHYLPDAVSIKEYGTYDFKRPVSEAEIVETAKALLSYRVLKTPVITNSQVAKDFFITQLSGLNCEVFCIAFLNTKHRIISCELMFRGTLNTANIYPREVVNRALALNAAR